METTIASEMLAASIGGAISASILFPLEVIKTKMQAVDTTTGADEEKEEEEPEQSPDVHRMRKKSAICRKTFPAPSTDQGMITFAKHIYQTEGMKVFFHGMETSAFQSALEKALYFFSYTALKQAYEKISGGTELTALTNLALGYAADWSHLPFTLPVDAWTTEIKTKANGRAPLKILLAMLSDKSRSFYKGLSAYYLLCLKPALQYTVYEQVKTAWLKAKPRQTLTTAEAFLLAMVARAVATIAVFPFLRAKVLLQTQEQGSDEGEESEYKPNTLDVLRQQWDTQGLSGLFLGLGPELTRGVFSAALMLTIKERIAGSVQSMLAKK
jgi:adenine nucleotide transporter 17